MAVELKVPSFGESITEALIARWIKKEGDAVAQDEPVVVLETDKVTSEVPAPASGVLQKVLRKEGDTVAVGEAIALVDEAARPAAAAPAASAPSPEVPAPAPAAAPPRGETPRVMPAAARAMHDAGLTATQVTPSGPGGRILKEDVARAAAGAGAGRAGQSPAPTGAAAGAGAGRAGQIPAPTGAAPVPEPVVEALRHAGSARQEDLVPMSPLRKRIAQRLVEAQATAALLTTFNEVDMSAVIALRAEYKDAFEKKHGAKLGFMSFFVKAAVDALKLVPQVNAQVQGEAILYRNYYDVGVAVGGGRGLVVPILRDADRLSFAEVEKGIADFALRAKENRLNLDELQGGTFTISNGGIYGSMLSTPIINFPQSGILGLHAIQDRPVARDGQVVIRPMMYVALTYDHRIIDGREAVTFLKRVKDCIENPQRLLLEV